jgi:hypothetical protein
MAGVPSGPGFGLLGSPEGPAPLQSRVSHDFAFSAPGHLGGAGSSASSPGSWYFLAGSASEWCLAVFVFQSSNTVVEHGRIIMNAAGAG